MIDIDNLKFSGAAEREFDLLTMTDKQRIELYEYVIGNVFELLLRDEYLKARALLRLVHTNQLRQNMMDSEYELADQEDGFRDEVVADEDDTFSMIVPKYEVSIKSKYGTIVGKILEFPKVNREGMNEEST